MGSFLTSSALQLGHHCVLSPLQFILYTNMWWRKYDHYQVWWWFCHRKFAPEKGKTALLKTVKWCEKSYLHLNVHQSRVPVRQTVTASISKYFKGQTAPFSPLQFQLLPSGPRYFVPVCKDVVRPALFLLLFHWTSCNIFTFIYGAFYFSWCFKLLLFGLSIILLYFQHSFIFRRSKSDKHFYWFYCFHCLIDLLGFIVFTAPMCYCFLICF